MKYVNCILVLVMLIPCLGQAMTPEETRLQQFIADYEKEMIPLFTESALASWQANVTGEKKFYDRQVELALIIQNKHSDKDKFNFLKTARQSPEIKEQALKRQMEDIYRSFLYNQTDPELRKKITEMEADIEQSFNTHRATIGDKQYTQNEIKDIMKNETGSAKRRQAWEASKQVGKVVSSRIIALVGLRNQLARSLGYENFHTFSLTMSEQDPAQITAIFAELDELTRTPYKQAKAEMDAKLSKTYQIEAAQMMPWHYHDPFFQEVPQVFEIDLDSYYKGKDIVQLNKTFYTSIDLPVEAILARSDLFEKPGKCPHAFCTDIDHKGDVRILCNIKDNLDWNGTTLHELGHAVYDYNTDPSLPWLLRTPPHPFTTEAIAMFFEREASNPQWMKAVLNLSEEEVNRIKAPCKQYDRLKQLIFARWDMVVYHFEKNLYANPEQDLNALWWDLVSRYQVVNRPENRNHPDWAAKIHIATSPCYYHNYLLGELLASQYHHYLKTKVLKVENTDFTYLNQKPCGEFFKNQVFKTGSLYHWDEMIRRATGESLTPKYFAADIAN